MVGRVHETQPEGLRWYRERAQERRAPQLALFATHGEAWWWDEHHGLGDVGAGVTCIFCGHYDGAKSCRGILANLNVLQPSHSCVISSTMITLCSSRWRGHDSEHTAHATKAWLTDQSFQVRDAPAQAQT